MTDLTKEAIQHIQDTTRQKAKTEVLVVPGDPTNSVWLRKDDKITPIKAENPQDKFSLERLTDVIDLVQHWTKTLKRKVSVFYNDTGIQVVGYDTVEADGTVVSTKPPNTAYLKLVKSDEFDFFDNQHSDPLIAMRELRKALRTIICKCPTDEMLLGKISSLQSISSNDRHAHMSNRGESLGYSVTEEAKSKEGDPNELQVFNVRLWANADLPVRFPVECLLATDVSEGPQWFLFPYEWALDDLKARSLDHVGDHLLKELDKLDVFITRGKWNRQSIWGIDDFVRVENANKGIVKMDPDDDPHDSEFEDRY